MSTIGTIGSSTGMENLHARKRPNPEEMAASLFSKLDTSGQGYLQKSDLQNALDKVSSGASSSSSGASTDTSSTADALFAKLDSDGDGKVTKDEFSSTLKKLSEQLDSHFANMRMQGGMNGMGGTGGMPPPPPANDAGFTKDELSSQLQQIGSSDSERSNLISNVVQNFDKADTNGDGKVSFQEAMAYQQASVSGASTSATASTASSTGDTTTATGQTTAANSSEDQRLLRQIMHLMQAYNIGGATQSSSTITATA